MLHVPELREPLLSVASICDRGFSVVFLSSGFPLYGSTALEAALKAVSSEISGYRSGNLYFLPRDPKGNALSHSTALVQAKLSLFELHCSLGHPGLKPLKALASSLGLSYAPDLVKDVTACEVCVASKIHQKAFGTCGFHRASLPEEVIHSDVGSFPVV